MADCVGPIIPTDLLDYFNRVYWVRKLGRQQRTRKLYLHTLAVFDRWLRRADVAASLGRRVDQRAELSDLNDDTVCVFLQHRLDEISPFSAAKDRSQLIAIATFAAKKRHIPEFLDVPLLQVAWPVPNAMRPEQFQSLLEATAKMPGYINRVPAPLWWLALLLMFLVTGERTQATLSSKWEWLGADGWLRLPADVRKGRKKGANYFLPPAVLRTIEQIRANQESGTELIFDRAFCIETFYLKYTKLLELAGLPTSRRWKPQCLRRTFGSYVRLLTGNNNPLDHDSPGTFKRHYDDATLTSGPKSSEVIVTAFNLGMAPQGAPLPPV